MHDARVFRNSPLYYHMTNIQNPLLPDDKHLIGDSAYPLLVNVMTPFRDNGHLTPAQTSYNINLSTIRSIIERAFGQLKGKFRRLKYLDIGDFALGVEMIASACILHNFIIENDEEEIEFDGNLPLMEEDQIQRDGLGGQHAAINKRNNIVNNFDRD